MNILSLDLEFNQPSNTIIQVGAVVGNIETGDILESLCIETSCGEQINPEIVKLTGVTQEQVDNGASLTEAYRALKTLHTKYDCFRNCLTWGGNDSLMLRNQLGLDDDRFLFGRRHIDAKTLFVSRCFARGERHQSGLARSMRRMGLNFEGRKHNAKDDALNTFRIYIELLKEFK